MTAKNRIHWRNWADKLQWVNITEHNAVSWDPFTNASAVFTFIDWIAGFLNFVLPVEEWKPYSDYRNQ